MLRTFEKLLLVSLQALAFPCETVFHAFHAQLCHVGGCSTDFILRDSVDIKFIITMAAESWIISASVTGKTSKRNSNIFARLYVMYCVKRFVPV